MNPPVSSEEKRILIVEDHPLFRGMLVQLIDKELGMKVCGEADNIKDAMSIIEKARPDVAIVDLTLQGSSGLELVKDVKARGINMPILVLSMHEEKLYAERVLRAGGRGYISKHAAPSDVISAIRKVVDGGIYLSEEFTGAVLERLGRGDKLELQSPMELLTDREIEVFQLVGKGMNSREIAEKLNLGVTTVDSYRQRIRSKMGLKNAAALYRRAAQWVVEQAV
jgi:DNA-binding NarL/FixJ family response regulator